VKETQRHKLGNLHPQSLANVGDTAQRQAFKIEQKEAGSTSLAAGDTMPLSSIKEFAAKPYTAEEEISLSEIIRASTTATAPSSRRSRRHPGECSSHGRARKSRARPSSTTAPARDHAGRD
jgi:hypothetical protein